MDKGEIGYASKIFFIIVLVAKKINEWPWPQEKLKELEEKETRHSTENWYIERSRLKDIIEEKNQQLEKVKREEETHRDHIDNIRREVRIYFKSMREYKTYCYVICQ